MKCLLPLAGGAPDWNPPLPGTVNPSGRRAAWTDGSSMRSICTADISAGLLISARPGVWFSLLPRRRLSVCVAQGRCAYRELRLGRAPPQPARCSGVRAQQHLRSRPRGAKPGKPGSSADAVLCSCFHKKCTPRSAMACRGPRPCCGRGLLTAMSTPSRTPDALGESPPWELSRRLPNTQAGAMTYVPLEEALAHSTVADAFAATASKGRAESGTGEKAECSAASLGGMHTLRLLSSPKRSWCLHPLCERRSGASALRFLGLGRKRAQSPAGRASRRRRSSGRDFVSGRHRAVCCDAVSARAVCLCVQAEGVQRRPTQHVSTRERALHNTSACRKHT